MRLVLHRSLGWFLLLLSAGGWAQPYPADSYATVRKNGRGTLTALAYGTATSDPFIFKGQDGQLMGVEYDVLASFARYLKHKQGLELTINWQDAGRFEQVLPTVQRSAQMGLIGAAYFSITPERQRIVAFTPPYMPDLNVVVTHNSLPIYTDTLALLRRLSSLTAFTMEGTTQREDIDALRRRHGASQAVRYVADDYEVMRHIAETPNSFGYVPLSIYITGLQRGYRVKRQPTLAVQRPGFAFILPKNSDWRGPLNEYFSSAESRRDIDRIIRTYLGREMSQLLFQNQMRPELDASLLAKEKEIVTQRLIDTAVEVETQKFYRNLLVLGAVALLIIGVVLYGRYQAGQQYNARLLAQHAVIEGQKQAIEDMNRRLELKVLQAQMNPHFIFNSLNAAQYFVSLNDQKQTLAYLSLFARFLRKLLANASVLTHSVQDEATMLEQYLALEKLRFPGKFTYSIELDDPATTSGLQVLPLLVHPFVENALYHGLLNRDDSDGWLQVTFSNLDDQLIVSVIDNGVGRETGRRLTRQKQFSNLTPFQRAVKDRIALFNQRAPQPITLSVTDRLENGTVVGTHVLLRFPQPVEPGSGQNRSRLSIN